MEDNNEMYKIQIPGAVKTRMEIFDGVGIPEIIYTAIGAGIGLLIGMLIYQIFKNYVISLIIFGICAGGTFASVIKDKNGCSIAQTIKNVIIFIKSQKVFKYTRTKDY